MNCWKHAPLNGLAAIDIILTDVDDTLTSNGRLASATLAALERLEATGVRIIPVTAASAGWGSQIASTWPVDAVIAENGGVLFEADRGGATRRFLCPCEQQKLLRLSQKLTGSFNWLEPSDDQPYRETCLAFRRAADPELNAAVLTEAHNLGAGGTLNSLWILIWHGSRDKLTASRRVLHDRIGMDELEMRKRALFVGDSGNDEVMFAGLPLTVGVSTVRQHRLACKPAWITEGAGGAGFIEVADRVCLARSCA